MCGGTALTSGAICENLAAVTQPGDGVNISVGYPVKVASDQCDGIFVRWKSEARINKTPGGRTPPIHPNIMQIVATEPALRRVDSLPLSLPRLLSRYENICPPRNSSPRLLGAPLFHIIALPSLPPSLPSYPPSSALLSGCNCEAELPSLAHPLSRGWLDVEAMGGVR